jgi:hypothetical protein
LFGQNVSRDKDELGADCYDNIYQLCPLRRVLVKVVCYEKVLHLVNLQMVPIPAFYDIFPASSFEKHDKQGTLSMQHSLVKHLCISKRLTVLP